MFARSHIHSAYSRAGYSLQQRNPVHVTSPADLGLKLYRLTSWNRSSPPESWARPPLGCIHCHTLTTRPWFVLLVPSARHTAALCQKLTDGPVQQTISSWSVGRREAPLSPSSTRPPGGRAGLSRHPPPRAEESAQRDGPRSGRSLPSAPLPFHPSIHPPVRG